MVGPFCSACGEKVFVPGEHSIRHFLGDVLNAITSVDKKFLRTLKLMVTSPGAMSSRYINGMRVPFVKPMSMFFIANLIYFLFPLYNTFDSKLQVQMNYQVYSEWATDIVKKRVKADKVDFRSFETQYNQQSINMAKLSLILLVVYFSVPLALVNYKKSLFYFDHLIVSLEFWSIQILVWFVAFHWTAWFLVWLVSLTGADLSAIRDDSVLNWGMGVFILYVLYRIERETYKASVLTSLAKATFLLACAAGAVFMYRASLFFVTLWTM